MQFKSQVLGTGRRGGTWHRSASRASISGTGAQDLHVSRLLCTEACATPGTCHLFCPSVPVDSTRNFSLWVLTLDVDTAEKRSCNSVRSHRGKGHLPFEMYTVCLLLVSGICEFPLLVSHNSDFVAGTHQHHARLSW